MDEQMDLAEAIGRARAGSQGRIRALLQSSPRRAHVLLRASIRRGVLPASSNVEEQSLIMSMMMSRNSIRSALQQLNSEGLVQRRQRLGTSVVGTISELPLLELLPVKGWSSAPREQHASMSLGIEHLEKAEVLADEHIQGRLRLPSNRVMMQEDLVTRGGEVIGIIVGYHPIGADVSREPDAAEDDRYNYLRMISRSHIEATVEAVNCDERTAKVLGVAEGAAILVRETLLYDSDGAPKMLAYGHYRGDRVALWAEDAAVPAMVPPGSAD
ncbi:GntR family transcriptional regulator [Frondihabitans cladoniiphilus]|uniref:HTH gntR-type domain-containing protein n=1 Tax=Frondihabitans cladoniiphilus TaxID=715785 RepID=A0ABP8W5K7_9MICO